MIREILIENYKSIEKLKLDLGRITVFVGENGCGKTNILEAIALASAAASNKLDNEFLVSRGIRVTEPQFMRSAFDVNLQKEIKFYLNYESKDVFFECSLEEKNQPYSRWRIKTIAPLFWNPHVLLDQMYKQILEIQDKLDGDRQKAIETFVLKTNDQLQANPNFRKFAGILEEFLVFSPQYSSLRLFEAEGQIYPLGTHGKGLFKLLQVMTFLGEEDQLKLTEIKEKMQLIEWFKDFDIPQDLYFVEKRIKIKDRYLHEDLAYFDQRSSNEGFLFLLFYFALFISDKTPNFFAIDNIDASLNPRLGRRLIQELVELAKTYDKQAIFTSHNPAILDGLNLEDDEQRLFVIYRNKLGHTKARRILNPEPLEGQEPVRLSEAFLRGYIGGLPKNF